jgi:ABC-2 type transport system permease protein
MKQIANKAKAFLKRDFQIAVSYQLNFLLTAMNSFLIVFLFFFISKLVAPTHSGIARYGKDFFSYIITGYAFFEYFQMLLRTFASSIQNEQITGSLEAMLSTQTSPYLCIFLSSLYSVLVSLMQLIVIFAAGVVFFGFSIRDINVFSFFIIFSLSIAIFVGFGILSASFIIVLKKGDPISWVIAGTNFILGGAFFPVSIMPDVLQSIAVIMPATYMLDALRLTILQNYDLGMVSKQAFILLAISVVLVPLSLYTLSRAIRKAKKDGTLTQY